MRIEEASAEACRQTLISQVRNLFDQGHSRAEIHARFASQGVNLLSLNAALKECSFSSQDQEKFWRKARVAGIYHLVDIKRAGHSPTRTEMPANAADGGPKRLSLPLRVASYYGSPSALASEGTPKTSGCSQARSRTWA